MKKVTSFLLVLVMVVSLLPGTAMPVSAVEAAAAPAQNSYYDKLIVHEMFDDITTGMAAGKLSTSSDAANYAVQVDGGINIKSRSDFSLTGSNKKREEAAIVDFTSKGFDFSLGFEVRFTADFTNLTIPKTTTGNGAMAQTGIEFQVRAASMCSYGFHADSSGNIYVTQWDSNANAVRFDTGLDLPAKDVDVRIVADDEMRSSVIVNGRCVARFNTPDLTKNAGNYFIVYSSNANTNSYNYGANDVTLYDLKLIQGAAVPKVQADYTYYAPVIDGSLTEQNWPFSSNGGNMVLLSDQHYLYAGFKSVNTYTSAAFTINGVALTADFAAGTVATAAGDWAGRVVTSGSNAELRIPLKSVLGLDYIPGQSVNCAYSYGGINFNGALVLAGKALVTYDAQLKADPNVTRNVSLRSKTALDPATGAFEKAYTIEFDAEFRDLVSFNEASPTAPYAAGLELDLRMDSCRRYGFYDDGSGNLMLGTRKGNSGESNTTNVAVSDVKSVRIEVAGGASGTATKVYFTTAAGTTTVTLTNDGWAVPPTGGRGYWVVSSTVTNTGKTLTGTNDFTVSNLKVTQAAPVPSLKGHPLGSGTEDATAYLNLEAIEMDGLLRENHWYTPHYAGGTAGPGALVGFGWGGGKLYVGGETRADSVTLTLGGKTLTADLTTGTASAGELAVGSDGFEWAIPLSVMGLAEDARGKQVSYQLALTDETGTSNLSGNLTLSGTQVLLGDTGRGFVSKEYETQNSYGHTNWNRSDEGYVVESIFYDSTGKDSQDKQSEGGVFFRKLYVPVNYTFGAYKLEVQLTIKDLPLLDEYFGQAGLMFDVWGKEIRAPYALRSDGAGNVIMDVSRGSGEQHADTKVDIGDRATFTIKVNEKQIPSLYVNDVHVHTFSAMDRDGADTVDSKGDARIPLDTPCFMLGASNTYRALNADGTLSNVDVTIHSVLLTQTPYEDDTAVAQAALDQITQESILGDGDPMDVTVMTLPKQLMIDGIGAETSVSWSAINKATGRVATAVDLRTGVVTRDTAALAFDLTANVRYKGNVVSKTFTFQTKGSGTAQGNVALIVKDDAPANGTVTNWNGDMYAYLDTTHNSIVVDQGGNKAFNRITLYDTDKYSRVSQRHLGVFVSEDGKTWTKVTGWLLHQSESVYTLYNLNQTARYVKVHCYHDNMEYNGEGPTFFNRVSDMIKVSNEKYLPGVRGKFAHSATFDAKNETEKEQKDTPVFISLESLKATSTQYKKGCADFRFTINNDTTTLAHWYNGQDGFYVRVPSIPAGGSTTITAHWGCSSAQDYSDGEAVFEVTYGNVSLLNLTRETYEANKAAGKVSAMGTHGRPFVFPNGDVIVVARTVESGNSDLAVYRSTDGGHTFDPKPVIAYDDSWVSGRGSGFGGFLWDAERDENPGDEYVGRLYIIGYNGNSSDDTDYRITLTYSDDWGHSWSATTFLTLNGAPVADIVPYTGYESKVDVAYLQNSAMRLQNNEIAHRSITYCDGLKVEKTDGNSRYVIIHDATVYDYTNGVRGEAKRNVTTATYSDDGGKTWYCSETLLSNGVDRSRNIEDGLTEAGFAQMDDGDLRLVIRNQGEDRYFLYEAISEDYGTTWTEGVHDVLSVNTSPVLAEYGGDRLQMWSACSGLGMASYRRTPMHLGLSTDEYDSFAKIIDLTFATSFDSLQDAETRKTQPGIAIDEERNRAFVSHWEQNRIEYGIWGGTSTVGFVLEDFDEMIRHTKGAWDDFEDSSLKYQGWLVDVDGSIELTKEQAVSGKYSMKVLDENSGAPTHAVRQIPSMKSGTVGAKLMAAKDNEAGFAMELKAAYNFDHMQFTVAALYITQNGSVCVVDANGKQTQVATVAKGSWNDYALHFDVETGKGTLYVNGNQAGDEFDLPYVDKIHGVTAVQFNQADGTQTNGDCLYVDDFFATEVDIMNRTPEKNDPVQSLVGRFITIIRDIITVDGKKVEIVEWGWVPGL